MQVVHHNLTSRWGKICVNTVSHAKCNVGEPHHVGSTFDSLPVTGCLPPNLVTHSSGRVHTCHLLNCCQRHMVRLTCYKANNTIHSLESPLEIGFSCLMSMCMGTFVKYLYHPVKRILQLWMKWHLTVESVLLSSGCYRYIEQDLLVEDGEHSNLDKVVNRPSVEFAMPACVTRQCERNFYEWTVMDFSEASQECSLIC